MSPAPESFFLRFLFERLNESDIRYAVMRNYELLPNSVGGSDLDILLHPEDEEIARAVISEAIAMAGGDEIGHVNVVGFTKISAFGRGNIFEDSWWGVEIDLFYGFYFFGAAQLLSNDILSRRFRLQNEIRVLPVDLAATLGVVKELLFNDTLPPRYLAVAANAAKNNWNELQADLAPIGEPALALLRDLCLTTPNSSDIVTKSCAFRYAVLRAAFLRSPLNFLRFRFLHEWSKVSRFLNSPGMVVTVLGADGAGKSTVITAIEPVLSAATHGAFIVKHLRPGFLPPLARFKGKKAQQGGPVTDPHGSNPSGWFGSLLRVFYLMADYVMGYWLVVRPKIAKSPAIFLFDRYAYDMVLDPHRFRVALPSRIIRWFTRLAPKPDLIFCLHGSPEALAARKQELPLEEVRRQVVALKTFAATEPRAILVSTETTIEETRDQILNAIAGHCAKRTKNTLRSD